MMSCNPASREDACEVISSRLCCIFCRSVSRSVVDCLGFSPSVNVRTSHQHQPYGRLHSTTHPHPMVGAVIPHGGVTGVVKPPPHTQH